MYPVYNQFMDSYPPRHVNQMHSLPHHHSGHYQSWPHPPHGYPGFNCYPGYFEPRPPYTPAPAQFCYPVLPVPYPVCYNCPPHYAVELPHYSRYPGYMSGGYGQCCGCPNHQPYSNVKEGNNVKIEEQSPDSGKGVIDDSRAEPFKFRNHPSPVVWIPPEFARNVVSNDSEPAEKEKYKRIAAKGNDRPQSLDEQKNFLNRWLPLLMDGSESTKQVADSARKQEQQVGDKKSFTNGLLPFIIDDTGLSKQRGETARKQGHKDGDKKSFQNGWLPFISDGSGCAKQRGKSASKQEHKAEDERKFPFPFILMPYNLGDSMENKANGKTNVSEENPEVMLDAEDKDNSPKVNEVTAAPTKSVESKPLKNSEEKMESSSVKHVSGGEETKLPQGYTKSKPSSPPKSSKLPPICLRVDPVNKKKNGKSSSRSPSPPGDKGREQKSARDSVQPPIKSEAKEPADRNMTLEKFVQELSKDAGQGERKVKTIEVSDGAARKDETNDRDLAHSQGADTELLESQVNAVENETNQPQESSSGVTAGEGNLMSVTDSNHDQAAVVGQSIDGTDSKFPVEMDGEHMKADEYAASKAEKNARNLSEDKAATIIQSAASKADENTRNLSEDEAAIIIQSAYRGYEVRRWEPLKKLKQIAHVRDEAVKLGNRISSDAQKDHKWRITIEETIMNLLLKLDTIQGLHPSIRDVRKSVARELVNLQEKVDGLRNVHELNRGDKFDKNQGVQGGDEFLRESSPLITDSIHEEVHPEFCEGVAATGTDNQSEEPRMVRNDEGTGATSEQPMADSFEVTITESSGTGSTSEIEANNDEGHSCEEMSLSQVKDDADSGASSLEALAESSGTNTGETTEMGLEYDDETRNALNYPILDGDEGYSSSLAPGRGDEASVATSLEPAAELLEAESGLPLENSTASENFAMVADPVQEFLHPQACGDIIHTSNDETASLVNDVSDLKEVTKSPIGHHADLQESYLLQFESGNENYQQGGTAMENDSQVKESTQMLQKVLDDGDEDSNNACQTNVGSVLNNDVSMDFNEKHPNNEVLDEEETQEVMATASDSSEMNDSLVICENIENIMENYTDEGIGSHEIPVEAHKQKPCVISTLGDDPEVHVKVSTEMVSEVQNVPGPEIALRDIESSEDATVLISDNGSPLDVNKCCKQENAQKPADLRIEMQVPEVAAGDGLYQTVLDEKDAKEGEISPPSPTASQSSLSGVDGSAEFDRKLIEENEKLRETMQKLIEAGNEQLVAISNLSGRVKDLEKKLWRKNKLKMRGRGTSRYTSRKACMKPSNDTANEVSH